MRNHPFWSISLYKITAIYVVVLNFIESNNIRARFFVSMDWDNVANWYTTHVYLILLFLLLWGVVYLVEASFGLTMGAFTIRSRAGVARWLDIAVLCIIPFVFYAAWVTKTTAPNFSDFELYRFISDAEHLFSPFLIWIVFFAGIAALQSLGPYGEYRFDRSQSQDFDAGLAQNQSAGSAAANTIDATTGTYAQAGAANIPSDQSSDSRAVATNTPDTSLMSSGVSAQDVPPEKTAHTEVETSPVRTTNHSFIGSQEENSSLRGDSTHIGAEVLEPAVANSVSEAEPTTMDGQVVEPATSTSQASLEPASFPEDTSLQIDDDALPEKESQKSELTPLVLEIDTSTEISADSLPESQSDGTVSPPPPTRKANEGFVVE